MGEIKAHVHRKTCERMFMRALFIITNNCKETKCPLTGEWINNLWFIQSVECYSARTKNEWLIHTTVWISLSSIMFSERGQTLKSTYCMITFLLSSIRDKANLW